MTKRERAVKDRPWLKTKVFGITNSLQQKLANSTLTDKEKEWVAYIQHKVLVEADRQNNRRASIGSKYFKDKIGRGYHDWVTFLKSIDELNDNESYMAAEGKGFPLRYWVPSAAFRTGVTKITFQRKVVQPPKTKIVQPCTDVVVAFVRNNLQKLTVAKSLLPGPDAFTDAKIHSFCWDTFFGEFKLRYGTNVKRLYHTVIEMDKEGRANLQLRDSSEQLFEYDVKTCHPVLMLNLFTDDAERRKFTSVLQADIYDVAAAVMQKPYSRAEVKDFFVQVINQKERDARVLEKKWVYRFFRQEFPIFTEQVLNVRSDMAVHLQNEEANLMVQELGRFCLAKNLFWIPCHDGWMGTAQHEQAIIGKVHELFFSATGFPVVVSKLELLERTTLCLSAYSPYSYVGGTDTSSAPLVLEKVGVEVAGVEKPAVVRPVHASPINPWRQVVEDWKRLNDPKELQEAAVKRAEARKRQKVGAKLAKVNKEASLQLGQQAGEALRKLNG